MSDIYQNPNDPFMQNPDLKKIPSSLNILTILTFIGCAVGFLFSIYGFTGAKARYDSMEKMMEDGTIDKMPAFMKNMMGPDALEMLRKTYENRIPILIISLVAIGLCFYGALEMRKLNKQGFYMWLLGELLPVICTVIFMGMGAFSGFGMIGIVIPIIFIILYAMQLKHLR